MKRPYAIYMHRAFKEPRSGRGTDTSFGVFRTLILLANPSEPLVPGGAENRAFAPGWRGVLTLFCFCNPRSMREKPACWGKNNKPPSGHVRDVFCAWLPHPLFEGSPTVSKFGVSHVRSLLALCHDSSDERGERCLWASDAYRDELTGRVVLQKI